ncbi:MAG: response regulator [Bryobacterales bacterium]|nr:response regulator [Bryobacterales bacterium]
MDDEEPVRDVLCRILGRNGYEVECAPDGAGAIALFKRAFDGGRPFSAVFLDLTVPGGVGGKEAVAQIRQIDSRVKAVATSGYSDGPVMAGYRQFGFDDVLPKPWTAGNVVEVVQRILSGGRETG